MRIIYPYNEILPKRRAHDIYIFHECVALAKHAHFNVSLLIGKESDHDLFSHYNTPQCEYLHIERLFILRKNNPLSISWNLPFFFLCQRYIERFLPNVVICSVRKQAIYHLQRKIPGVHYIYEVHELASYPNTTPTVFIQSEREMLSRADLITVTTQALKRILEAPPYALTNRIEVVPLAVQSTSLRAPATKKYLQVAYVGQLYSGQGLPILLKALSQVNHVHLKIIGGNLGEINNLKKLARELGVEGYVTFLGFVPPNEIPSILHDVHAFVAPFENTGRMPYVAHTKLFEYAQWGRPIIAPDLPIVREHFSSGAILYEPDSPKALAAALNSLLDKPILEQLQTEILAYQGRFSWATRIQTYTHLLNDIVNNF